MEPPRRYIKKSWTGDYFSQALKKSAQALQKRSLSTFLQESQHTVRNLFFINDHDGYFHSLSQNSLPMLLESGDVGQQWGKQDMMLDLSKAGGIKDRVKWLQAAANFGGALYLVRLDLKWRSEEMMAWWEALRLSRTSPPRSLFFLFKTFGEFSTRDFSDDSVSELFEVLKQRTGIKDVVLYRTDCMFLHLKERDFSLYSLHIEDAPIYPSFLDDLANLDNGSISHRLTLHQSGEMGMSGIGWLPSLHKILDWSISHLSLDGFNIGIPDVITFMRALVSSNNTSLQSLSLGKVRVSITRPQSISDYETTPDRSINSVRLPSHISSYDAYTPERSLSPLHRNTTDKLKPHESPSSVQSLYSLDDDSSPLRSARLDDEPSQKGSFDCKSNDYNDDSSPSRSARLEYDEPSQIGSIDGKSNDYNDDLSPLVSLACRSFNHDESLKPSDTDFVGAVVDALHQSGLPFLTLGGLPVDPAIEAQLLRNQQKRSHILKQQSYKKIPAIALRLFICGDAYAGKTTLLSSLSAVCSKASSVHKIMAYIGRHGPSSSRKNSRRTQGIEVCSIVRDNIQVSVWDMAGQQEFHAFHDHMFPDPSSGHGSPAMFMFVWSPVNSTNEKQGIYKEATNFEASFRYWLKFIASKTRQSNVTRKLIVVLTRKDQMDFVRDALAFSINTLAISFNKIVEVVEVLEVDARSPNSVKPVASSIFKIARALLYPVQIYDVCNVVSRYLSQVGKKMPPIVTWDLFSRICEDSIKVCDGEVHKAIASSLNEAGDIIYLNNLPYIVLNPDWFCHEIMGTLIHFAESHTSRAMPIRGYAKQDYLKKLLERSSHSKVNGAILVELMEAMHLCCKVPNDPHGTILIPATLPDRSGSADSCLQWRSGVKWPTKELAYVGRRLQCDREDLTFLTPGLFPMIQVVFNKAFGDFEADVKLSRDLLSICIQDMEILVDFGLARGGHVIDVMMRAPVLARVGSALTHVKEEIIRTLIRVCAQPVGNQGVKLVECVIRPDCLHAPAPSHVREDQYVPIQDLKQRLRRQIEQGQQPNQLVFFWKENQYVQPATDTFIDLLGFEDYMEVLESYRSSLKSAAENAFQRDDSNAAHGQDEVPTSASYVDQGDSSWDKDDDAGKSELEPSIVTAMSKGMAKAIFREMQNMNAKLDGLRSSVDSMHENLRSKLDVMHQNIGDLRSDLISAIQMRLEQILHFGVETEAGRVPRMVFLTTENLGIRRRILTALIKDIKAVRIELFCEHQKAPHRVDGQKGLRVTTMGEGTLKQALPYVIGFLSILTLAAKVGAHAIAGSGSMIPDFSELITYGLATDPGFLDNAHLALGATPPPTALTEWQQWLVGVLEKHGGMTESNIASKFMLRRALYEDTFKVAWLCESHYREQRPFPLV